jgi:YibE/F-like protein
MFVTLVLTNGLGTQTLAAALGVSATPALACGLAGAGVALADLDGRSNELSLFLGQQNSSLSLRGVVLAGMIVGALRLLADTAVTQASAVMALRRADPGLGADPVPPRVRGGPRLPLATIHTSSWPTRGRRCRSCSSCARAESGSRTRSMPRTWPSPRSPPSSGPRR